MKSYFYAAVELIKTGDYGKLWKKVVKVFKLKLYGLVYAFRKKRINGSQMQVVTQNPVAYDSPDHIVPTGTKNDNSTNKIFVIKVDRILKKEFSSQDLGIMDLGCSGGAMVADFRDLGYRAVGLEGSDYSLKHKRAHWSELANKNLFTCDITKEYQVMSDSKPCLFNCVTAWEVMEHIDIKDLLMTFKMIAKHLALGGYLIFSTTDTSDIRDGVELHQTKMTSEEWISWVEANIPELKVSDIGLDEEEYVRQGSNKTLVFKRSQ